MLPARRSSDSERLLKSIHEMLHASSVSDAGRRWMLQALDPAHDHGSDGFPDTSAQPVFRPITTAQRIINFPPGLEGGVWDCAMAMFDEDAVGVYYATGPAGTDFSSASYTGGDTAHQYGYIPLYQSIVGELSSAWLSISRSTGGTPPDPDIVAFPASDIASPLQPSAVRSSFRGLTVTLNSADVNNFGQVYAAQFSGVHSRGQSAFLPTPSGSVMAYNTDIFRLPCDENDLMATVPNAYTAPARDGIYVPMRYGGPQNEYGSSRPTSSVASLIAYNASTIANRIDMLGAESHSRRASSPHLSFGLAHCHTLSPRVVRGQCGGSPLTSPRLTRPPAAPLLGSRLRPRIVVMVMPRS